MKCSLAMLALCSVMTLSFLGANSAKAQLVYDNGAVNGGINGHPIYSGFDVSNSFTISSPTALTSPDRPLGRWRSDPTDRRLVDWYNGFRL